MSILNSLLVLGVVSLLAAATWKRSVEFAVIVTILEGALRKWAFPGASHVIYFLKDFLFLGAYVGYYLSARPKHQGLHPGLGIPLILGCAAVVVQGFNSNLGSPVAGFLGIKAYLWYVPLLWVVCDLFQTKEEFFRFTRRLLFLSVSIGILAVAQFNAPPDSRFNVYVAETDNIALFGEERDRAQVTGTFSYISGYTSFLMFAFCLLVPKLLGLHKPAVVCGHAAVLALLLGNMCMTGSRKNFVFVGMTVFTVSCALFQQRRMLTGAHRTILAGVAAVGFTLMIFGDAVSAILVRAQTAEDFTERTRLFWPLLKGIPVVGLHGLGAGVSLTARTDLASLLNVAPPKSLPPYIDFEAHQVLWELGALGFLAWYALRFALLWGLWRTWHRVRDPRLRVLAAGAFAFHLAHLYLSVYLNHIANVYFWFMAGFILLLPRLDGLDIEPKPGIIFRVKGRERRRRTPIVVRCANKSR